ncbi:MULTISPECIES: helix-turn-helix domain-containing protein [unclassified Butyrivibrio]|uniref:helix-turn-helix domain-containing protein n=1 Tax=unclassified Butyrivibrio TaxID=2639466 RepID=UPI00040F391E|nr:MULTISPECIES: helix-turn-helix domain-containing protein [unclassified Butyrivibrio]
MKDKYNAYCMVEPVKEYTAKDIKDIRKKTGTTQGFLAKWLGVSKKTVQAWELGTNIPNGPSARLLSLLDAGIIHADTFVDNKE